MKKLSFLFLMLSPVLLISSCSSVKPEAKNNSTQTVDATKSSEQSAIKKAKTQTQKDEYTHEMAEADADDIRIRQAVGVSEIDDELPGNEETDIPYRRDFLSIKKTKRMEFWVDYFTKKNHERFQRFIDNGEEYRPIIEKIFEAEGLPKELYFVGLIESGYYLGARSHASAVGPWQFIKGTGHRYGLRITSEIDERQDLFKSSKAAAMYFKDLHNVFSSWELALSAYNAGEYGIIRRIMKHGTRDFYELSRNKQLPSETINYVPKVLAAMHIVNNAKKYGFVIPKKKQRLFDLTGLMPTEKNVSLSQIAKRLNVDVDLLKKLNPELRKSKTPRNLIGTYYLRVPQSKYNTALFDEVAKTTPSPLAKPESRKELNRRTALIENSIKNSDTPAEVFRPKSHQVKKGETFFSISRKYGMSVRELAKINGMKSWKGVNLQKGQTLNLSKQDQQRVATRTVGPKIKITNKPIVYKIRRGDNLTDLAKLFDIKVSRIKKANNLKKAKIMVGQKIILPDTKKGIYIVKKGDHLSKVAKDLRRPIEALVKLNSLKKKEIYPGQKIIVNMD